MKARWALASLGLWIVVAALETHQAVPRFDWSRALPAAAWQTLAWVALAALLQASLRAAGIVRSLYELFPLILVARYQRESLSEEGPAPWLAADARAEGHAVERAGAAVILGRLTALWAFTAVFGASLLAYPFHAHPDPAAGLLSLLAFAAVLLPAGATLHGLLAPVRMQAWLASLEVRAASLFPAGWAARRAAEFTEAAVAVAREPTWLVAALAAAVAQTVLQLATLGALLLATGWHGPVALLCAPLTVAVLAWEVPSFPQRAGLVESLMTLSAIAVGVPAPNALVAVLGDRLISLWLPSWLGAWLLQGGPSRLRRDLPVRAGLLSVRAVAALTALMGVVNAVSGLRPGVHERIELLSRWLPLAVHHGSRIAAVLLGYLLLSLSRHLWHRKRMAWILAELALALSAVSHLLKGLDYIEAALSLALALWLWSLQSWFHARSDPPSVRQGTVSLIGAAAFTFCYGTAGFWLIGRPHDLASAAWQTGLLLTGSDVPTHAHTFVNSVYAVASGSLAWSFVLFLRPVLTRRPATAEEWARARAIVEAHGCTSLAPFALLTDKSYFFSAGGSVVAYVLKGRVALVLADPIGPADDQASALSAFKALCEANDWTPAFLQTGHDTVPLYQAAGLETCAIGQEAVVDLAGFTLAGGAAKNLRTIINRVKRAGYRAEVHRPPLSPELMAAMRSVSDEWLTMMHGSEKHFCLGWFDEAYLQRGPVCAVYDADGSLVAFANILTEYRKNEATGDLMRRRRRVENGTMEFLFVSLFEWAKAEGYATFSLGLCPLAGVGERPDDPGRERAVHHVYEHVNQFYNFKGLHAFKEKFHPVWTPRYIVYPARSLPAVAIAIIRATSGDTFVWDALRDFLSARLQQKPQPETPVATEATTPA